ncbi:TPA: hypothetical protein NBT51_003488 [Vibrio parahaemolyticus]|nr:hypothetical protein [Vibrio parahaemolyticus]
MISYTLFASKKPKELRKTYSLSSRDGVVKTPIANMSQGTAATEVRSNLLELNTAIDSLKNNEALATGVFPIDNAHIVAGEKKACPEKGVYSRTLAHMKLPKETDYIQLLDIDPHKDGVTFETAEQVIEYINGLNPVFKGKEKLVRPSSSAGIQNNGELLKAHSWHAFIKVSPQVNQKELKRFIDAQCWLNEDGYIALSKSGAKLERCTFDMAVFSHERLIFEAKPKLNDGLSRNKIPCAYVEGDAFLPSDLVTVDYKKVELLKAQAKAAIDGQSLEQRKAFVAEKVEEMISDGVDNSLAMETIKHLTHNELTLSTLVELECGAKVSIQELCDNHKKYNNVAMADPIEGRSYGTTTAKFFWNNGKPVIHSFAHGGTTYKLVEDYKSPLIAVETIPLSEKLNLLDFPYAEMRQNGKVIVPSTIESTRYLMERYGFKARYNVISKNVELTTPMDNQIVSDKSYDFGVSLLQSQASKNQLNVRQIPAYVNAIAQYDNYNPVVDWFNSIDWDGVSRINDLLSCIEVEAGWEGARETYMTKWLLGAAGMQKNTGTYSTRGTLVFAGKQNIGKTYFLQILAGDMWKYCLDGLTLNPSDRDSVKRFISQWLVELGELDATFRKSDISALKAFLTLKKDEIRLSYDRSESKFPRRTVAVASVNDREFLRDDTGNSRYWCLPVIGFNFEKMRAIDMQQLWAEVWQQVNFALDMDSVALPWFLDDEENKTLAQRNAEFEVPCEITATLVRYIKPNRNDGCGGLHNCADIIRKLRLPPGQKTSTIVGKVMRDRLGYSIATPKSKRCYRVSVPDIENVTIANSFNN